MRTAALTSLALLSGLSAPVDARADEPVMLQVEGAALLPVSAPQTERFQPGALLSAGVLFAPTPYLLPALRLGGGFLADGAAPSDASLRDPGVGGLLTLTAGLRLRPLGLLDANDVTRGTSFYVELDAGAGMTGSLVRPVFEVGVGYGFEVGDVDLGPVARFVHVLQTDDALDPSSAFLVTLGLEAVIFDRRPAPFLPDAPVDEPDAVEPDVPTPELDRDGDGILDTLDACPDEPEDRDGFEDEDGCPDLDDDLDGIADALDACPRQPEDRDGFEDEDGCPDPDNDGDRILDGADACPDAAETVNGNADDDGCPDEGLIELIGDRIVLEETVLFQLNRARVRSSARPVHEAIVTLWQQHPDWVRVRIEGHADVQGEELFNVALSERRAARVVVALTELGMPATMFASEGFGSRRPRVEGDTEEAYQANRRVEFVVVERTADGRPARRAEEMP